MIKRKKREGDSEKKGKKSAKIRKPALSDKKLRKPKAEYLVVPSDSRSLPWCLFSPTENGNLSKYPGNTSDFIIRNLFAEFKTVSRQKIVDILCLNVVCILFKLFVIVNKLFSYN